MAIKQASMMTSPCSSWSDFSGVKVYSLDWVFILYRLVDLRAFQLSVWPPGNRYTGLHFSLVAVTTLGVASAGTKMTALAGMLIIGRFAGAVATGPEEAWADAV